MEILKEVLTELFSMFVADLRLTLSALILVAIVAGIILGLHANPLLGGGVLLIGCIGIIVEATHRETRIRKQIRAKKSN